MKKYDVFGIGTALVDFFAKSTDQFLVKNGMQKGATNFLSREKLDALHERVSRSVFMSLPGDNARNVCEGVSHLGGKAAYSSGVGKDAEGDFFLKDIEKTKIISFVEERPGRTGKIIVFITPDGQRTFAVDLGNGLNYDVMREKEILESRFLYLSSITLVAKGPIGALAERAINFAKKEGVKFAFSIESPPMIRDNHEKILAAALKSDILFANEEELAALEIGEEDAAGTLSQKIGLVCLKMGEKGSMLFSKEKTISIPSYSTKTVDTTGAGDFYASGIIYGLSHGKPLEECGTIGAKVAGKVVERFGATLR